MELQTADIDKFEEMSRRMQAEMGADLPTSKATITADRERPGFYLVIVEFESFDEAMRLSNDPRMQKYAGEMSAMCNAPIKFYNLDVKSVM
jgi:hypothetical protein